MSDNDLIRRGDALDEINLYRSDWDYAREAIASLPAAPTFTAADLERAWQPIETARKDELETVILYSPEGVQVGFYSDFHRCWLTSEGKDVWDMPTHWMPLPEPPADLAQRVKE